MGYHLLLSRLVTHITVMFSHFFQVKNCLVAHVPESRILGPTTKTARLSEGLLQRLTFLKQPYVGWPCPRIQKQISYPFRSNLIQLLIPNWAPCPSLSRWP